MLPKHTQRSTDFPSRLLTLGAVSLLICSSISAGGAGCGSPPAWTPIGPSPLLDDPAGGADSGLVADIAIDPNGFDDRIIYIATGRGGIWKTTDGGATWSPKTDGMGSLCMGAVALDPADSSIVYAGTGNFFANFRNQRFASQGIYRSSDGGVTWVVAGGSSAVLGQYITRIVVPFPGTLLVGTFNGIDDDGAPVSGGLFKSVDGGVNFGDNPPAFDNGFPVLSGPICDIDVDTASPWIIYASVARSGVYESDDMGSTFPINLFTSQRGAPSKFGYLCLAQSKEPDNQTLYVNVQLAPLTGTSTGLYKSTDHGGSWTPIVLGDEEGNRQLQKWYDQTVGVDPKDANRVFFGLRALYLSVDGGATGIHDKDRIDLDKVHADQHVLVFSPHHPIGSVSTRLYNGTDGGIATTADASANGAATWTRLNGSGDCFGPNTALGTIMFYEIDIGRGSTANNRFTYGAAQDQGISSHRNDCPGTPWVLGIGGDGDSIAVDPLAPVHAIAGAEGFTYSTPDGKNWPDPDTIGDVGLPAAPSRVYFDPHGGVAYAVVNGTALYQSLNNGAYFNVIHNFPSGITALRVSEADFNVMWVGLGDGSVQRTENVLAGLGSAWSPLGAPNPFAGVSSIATETSSAAEAVVIYVSSSHQAFRTTDRGMHWTDVSGDLPAVPLRSAVIDPNTSPHAIIVATDNGVMQTMNGGVNWAPIGPGLPNVLCSSLALDATAFPSLLRVGTYGRGVYELAFDRQYVDWRNNGTQDGTREQPFHSVAQAKDAPANGASRHINIQQGDYSEGLITIGCGTLHALNGPVTIR
jgi:photosystem II stability/assembly factor-like uncharacterized protein